MCGVLSAVRYQYYKAAKKGAKAFNEAEILSELPPSLGGDIAVFLVSNREAVKVSYWHSS